MKMICRDLQSASLCSEKLAIDIPLPSCQKNLFFLRRTPSEDLVTIGYFLDPNKKHHCYRFFATSNETLAARCKGHLTELEAHASPNDAHSIILSKHLLSWEITPIWNKDNKLILLEINLAFGKTIPRYFLSTVVRLPPS